MTELNTNTNPLCYLVKLFMFPELEIKLVNHGTAASNWVGCLYSVYVHPSQFMISSWGSVMTTSELSITVVSTLLLGRNYCLDAKVSQILPSDHKDKLSGFLWFIVDANMYPQ